MIKNKDDGVGDSWLVVHNQDDSATETATFRQLAPRFNIYDAKKVRSVQFGKPGLNVEELSPSIFCGFDQFAVKLAGMAQSEGLLRLREAAAALGISYPTLKQWIYKKKINTITTAGGHHRVPQSEIDRFLNVALRRSPQQDRRSFQKISGRNQLVGRIVDVKIEGLLAQVKLSVGGQIITSIITAEAAREMRLKRGQAAGALVKSTEVMIVRL